jgi:hypothetical protein
MAHNRWYARAVEAGLQRRIDENDPATTERGSTHRAAAADVVDAQLSALLESVEADRAHVRRARERSDSAAAGAATQPGALATTRPRRRRKRPSKRERARGDRRTDARARVGRVALKPEPAGIRYFRDPVARETAYYIIVAVVSGAAVGLLCARLVT